MVNVESLNYANGSHREEVQRVVSQGLGRAAEIASNVWERVKEILVEVFNYTVVIGLIAWGSNLFPVGMVAAYIWPDEVRRVFKSVKDSMGCLKPIEMVALAIIAFYYIHVSLAIGSLICGAKIVIHLLDRYEEKMRTDEAHR